MPHTSFAALRLKSAFLCAPFLLACSDSAWTVADAEQAAQQSVSAHPSYRAQAVRDFWGDAAFLRACAPPSAPVADPFDIYFEVLPTGRLGRTLFVPETAVARCVKDATSLRAFSVPPERFVVKIAMKFRP